MSAWQLPEGIDELTGAEALAFEFVRRQLLDLYADKGFGLVIPPMVEYVKSLLLTSDSVDEKTFKFLDSASGKMLGVQPILPRKLLVLMQKVAVKTLQNIATLMLFYKPKQMIFTLLVHRFKLALSFMVLMMFLQMLKLLN